MFKLYLIHRLYTITIPDKSNRIHIRNVKVNTNVQNSICWDWLIANHIILAKGGIN